MQYGYKKLLSDIRQDLAKYVELYPDNSDKPMKTLRVLLHSPAYYVIVSYRILYWLRIKQKISGSRLVNILFLLLRGVANQYSKIVMKTSISHWPEIGPGLYLSNKGGIIMGPNRIGCNCVIHHNVTIGVNQDKEHPDIGDNVWIGSNSLICGRMIKDNVIVQADTIVTKNVPASVVIKGNPGRIIHRNQ